MTTGGWHGAECFKEKECVICNKLFKPKSGVHKFCSPECKGKWQYRPGGAGTTENQYKYISGNWRRYLGRTRGRLPERKFKFTVEYLLKMLEKQGRKCAISGVEMTCKLEKGKKFMTNASIDRINAGGTYDKDNIHLVCSAINSLKHDHGMEELIWWCKQVAKNNP